MSTRFPVAVHILTVLALKRGEFVSASLIAKSVGTNRVVVSRILSLLKEAKFITSQQGLHGGAKLIVSPEDISLARIFEAVEDGQIAPLHAAQEKCPVACCVKQVMQSILHKAECAYKDELADTSLEDVAAAYK